MEPRCLARAIARAVGEPGKIQHETLELLRQRVFWDRLWLCRLQRRGPAGHDAVHKLLLDRDPIAGRALASQPTLSRFENTGAMTPETASCAIPCAKGGH
jgi:hypothetical protein